MLSVESSVLAAFAEQMEISVTKITKEERIALLYITELLQEAQVVAGYRSTHYSGSDRLSAEDASRWSKIHAEFSKALDEMNSAPPAILRAIEDQRGLSRLEFYRFVEAIGEFVKRVEPDGLYDREVGRPRNNSLELTIYHLAKLFEDRKIRPARAPSRKTKTGPFYRFCLAIFRAANAGELARHSESTMRRVCSTSYRPPGVEFDG